MRYVKNLFKAVGIIFAIMIVGIIALDKETFANAFAFIVCSAVFIGIAYALIAPLIWGYRKAKYPEIERIAKESLKIEFKDAIAQAKIDHKIWKEAVKMDMAALKAKK